jgi:hypothetical protein
MLSALVLTMHDNKVQNNNSNDTFTVPEYLERFFFLKVIYS